MKCAIELQIIAVENARRKAEEEKLRKQLEQQRKLERTTALCEDLGKELETLARQGDTRLMVTFRCTSWHTPLKQTYDDYADGRLSYKTIGGSVDMDYLIQWFEQFCFQVKLTPVTYWMYNWGECKGFDVTISPKPQCLE